MHESPFQFLCQSLGTIDGNRRLQVFEQSGPDRRCPDHHTKLRPE